MKLLSIAIPCYNSEAYMENCIKSLLPGGDEVEILVIDDGSKDRTAEIADEYQEKYPGIVRAIHQPNLGHGGAVNTGIHNAQGLYFKVVDSDDWVNEESYKEILKTLEELVKGSKTVDLLISNFVYEKQGATRKKVMQYRHCLPVNQIFTWNEVGHMPKGKYLLMHSMIYRTQLLLECNLTLPEHTFYVMLLIRQICDMWHNWHLRWFNCTIIGICIKIVCYLKWIILVYHKHTIFRKKCPISSVNRLQLFKSVKFDPIKPIISPIL